MKLILTMILLPLLINGVFCQDTTYFDNNWQRSDKQDAYYYRVDRRINNGYQRTDYFIANNQIQMIGQYSTLDPEIKVGNFKRFYSNGELRQTGEYEENKEKGEHIWYFENGKIEAIENYTDGILNGVYKEFNENGSISVETVFENGRQNGITKYYREDGSLHSEGKIIDGERSGVWKYYDEYGAFIGEEEYKTDYLIEEARMFIRFPNLKWSLTDKTTGDLTSYIFKREEITDAKGRQIIPAIMIYVQDASEYDDLTVFSIMKQRPLLTNGVVIDEILIHENEGYPISYNNSFWYKCHYTQGDFDHILYMVHIINEDNMGIEVYMDMTKDIAEEYEKEFVETLKTIEQR